MSDPDSESESSAARPREPPAVTVQRFRVDYNLKYRSTGPGIRIQYARRFKFVYTCGKATAVALSRESNYGSAVGIIRVGDTAHRKQGHQTLASLIELSHPMSSVVSVPRVANRSLFSVVVGSSSIGTAVESIPIVYAPLQPRPVVRRRRGIPPVPGLTVPCVVGRSLIGVVPLSRV